MTDLKTKIKSLLENEEHNDVARRIVERSKALGDLQFIFRREAEVMARLDSASIKKFFEDVIRIKDDTAVEYYMATKHLIGEDNE